MDIAEMNRIFTRGGGGIIDFLNYCIISAQIDPIFVYLVEKEYKNHPSKKRAIALYDVFCDTDAPLRVNCDQVLPPTDTTLSTAIQAIQASQTQAEGMNKAARKISAMFGARVPSKLLFDPVVQALRGVGSESTLTDACGKYDPNKDAMENNGGGINSNQQSFVRTSWARASRPILVAAGFRIVVNLVGGGL